MRSFVLATVLSAASLGLLGAFPSSAEAGPLRPWRDAYYYPPTVAYYSNPYVGTTVTYGPTWTTSAYTPSGATAYYTAPTTTYYYPTYRTYYFPRRAYWSNYGPVYYYP
jgi:hypothetical protein